MQAERYDRFGQGRLLIFCPKTLIKSAWGNDFERFAPRRSVALAYATNRERAFAMGTDVVITNIDAVKWVLQQLKRNKRFLDQFSDLVIDEITAFKHHGSARSKAMKAVSKHFAYRYGLTATPNPNSVTELHHQALIIDDGKRLGPSYYHFRNSVQVPEQVGPLPQHLAWSDKPGAEMAVTQLLADITIRHDFDDVMTHVPPNHRHFKTYALPARLRAQYEKLERDAFLRLTDGAVTAVHKASLRNKLLQLCSGAVYGETDEEGKGDYHLLDAGRYELILDLTEAVPYSVVFFNWRHQREQLLLEAARRDLYFAVLDGGTKDSERDGIVQRFQDGQYDVLFLHPKTGAHGLTLTASEQVIFSSPIYEADYLKQGIARIRRGVQDKVTNTIFVEAEGTIERQVYERVGGKESRMVDFLDILRERRS